MVLKKEVIAGLATALLIISSVFFAFHYSSSVTPEHQLSDQPMLTASNAAYLNSTVSYYTNLGIVHSGIMRFNASFNNQYNYYAQTWYLNNEPIGNSSLKSAPDIFLVGAYQYWGGSPIGNGIYHYDGGSYYGSFQLGFHAGVDSNGHANVGTVHSNLLIYDIANGTLMSSVTCTDTLNETFSGNSAIITVEPIWTPVLRSGYYDFELTVSASSYTNYNSGNPYDLFCTLPGGNSPMSAYPILGWTYSGLTEGFPIKAPANMSAFQFVYNSTEPIQVNLGGITSSQSTQNTLTFYSNTIKSGQFQNILGDPNVTNITVNFSERNVVVATSDAEQQINTISDITQNQNWYNASYQFILDAPTGALNGALLDGKEWNTSWGFNISHILDPEYNLSSPINYFYMNNNLVSSPSEYNNLSGVVVDSNKSLSVDFVCNAGELVNYYPRLVSNGSSESSDYIGQQATFYVNVTELVTGEKAYISVNWGDGTDTTSMLTNILNFTLKHFYSTAGNYTPVFNIVNTPNADKGSLSSQQYSLPAIAVYEIPISGKLNLTSANPFEPVNINITLFKIINDSKDTIQVNFGDNNVSAVHNMNNFSVSHQYHSNGTYVPLVQIMLNNTIIESKLVGQISIGPVVMIPYSRDINGTAHVSLDYSSLSTVNSVSLYVGGQFVKNFVVENSKGMIFYNYSMNFPRSTKYLWVATTIYGYMQNDSAYYNLPVINSFTSFNNPSSVGQSVDFDTSVGYDSSFFYSLFINGIQVESQPYNYGIFSYIFSSPGTYNVTLIAQNGYGSVSASFVQNVEPMGPTMNVGFSSVIPLGETAEFNSSVSWSGNQGSVTWTINNNTVLQNSTVLSYKFQSPGSYSVTAKATNNYGSTQVNMTVVVVNSTPVINSINISPPNPKITDTVSLSASIDWMNLSGNLTWEVDGKEITGNLYTFNSSGNYTITAIATNQYGIISHYSIKVNIPNHEFHSGNPAYVIIGAVLSAGIVSSGIIFLYIRKKK